MAFDGLRDVVQPVGVLTDAGHVQAAGLAAPRVGHDDGVDQHPTN